MTRSLICVYCITQLKSDLSEAVVSAVDGSLTHVRAYHGTVIEPYIANAVAIKPPTNLTPHKREYPAPDTFR